MTAKRTETDARATVHSDEDTLETPCSNLLTRLPDDQFVHILSLFSLHRLVSLRSLSIEIKARMDELSLKITALGARLFPHVRSTHGFLELPGERIRVHATAPEFHGIYGEGAGERHGLGKSRPCLPAVAAALALRCSVSCSSVACGVGCFGGVDSGWRRGGIDPCGHGAAARPCTASGAGSGAAGAVQAGRQVCGRRDVHG